MIEAKDLQSIVDSRLDEFEPDGPDIFRLNAAYAKDNKERLDRIETIDNIIDQKWATVFPDNIVRQGKAMIADSISSDMGDVALLGAKEPTVICDPIGKPVDTAQARAETRQQALHNYRHRSRLDRKRVRFLFDLSGTGMASVVVWPDRYGEAEYRFPRFIRKNPRAVLLDPDCVDEEDLSNACVPYLVKARALEQKYPGVLAALFRDHELEAIKRGKSNTEVKVIEFYDDKRVIKIAGVNLGREGRDDIRTKVLDGFTHPLGKPLLVPGVRASFDGKFRGQFDNSVAPLGSANELYTLMLEQAARYVHSKELWVGDFDDDDIDGPGARIRGREGASIQRIAPDAVSPQAFAMVAQSIDMARSAAGIPSARSGEGLPSIISAQGITSAQGKLITQVADYQAIIADMEQRANALALEMDEKMLGTDDEGNPVTKSISGMVEGRVYQVSYSPKKDIAGVYDNRVEFGAGSDLDKANASFLVMRQLEAKIISRRRARTEILQNVNIQEEEKQSQREAVEDSILAGLQETPDPANWMQAMEMRLKAAIAFEKGDKSLTEIAEELLIPLSTPEPTTPVSPAAGPGGGPGIEGTAEVQAALPRLQDLNIRRQRTA